MADLTFILHAQLVDPAGNPRVGVPVLFFAVEVSNSARVQLSEEQFTNEQGLVEIEVTDALAAMGSYLASIQLRQADTDYLLTEQLFSLTHGNPLILDFGVIRVWDEPIFELPSGPVIGALQPLADALGTSPDVAALQAELAAAQALSASLQAQLDDSQAQLVASQNAHAAAQSQLTATQNQLAVSQNAHAAAQSQLTATQNQLASVQSQLASTQEQLVASQNAHASTQNQLASTQEQLATLQTAYDEAASQIGVLTGELEALQAGSGATSSIGAVVENVGMQLSATQQALVASGSPFQLGKLSLSIKVVPSSSTAFGLPTMEELASLGGEALSTLHLDFAQTAHASAAPTPAAAVPSLVGLTEPAARRHLAALGLGASAVHQAIADDGDVALAGRVLKQIPAAGMVIPPGSTVTLVFGKALGSAS
jgi:PASTA domain